jgi:O-antigen/teichoic acid export membrane protein
MFTSVGVTLLTVTDTLLLTWYTTLDEVGVYQAALPTANILLIGVSVVYIVLFPLVGEMWAKRQRGLIRAAVHDLDRYLFLVLLPIIIAFVSYPKIILNVLFGGVYTTGAPILAVLAFAALFLVLNAVHTGTLSGMGMPGKNAKVLAIGAVFNVIGSLVLIPRLGGFGAGCATLLASILMFLTSGYYVHRQIGVKLPYASWGKTAIAGAAFIGVIQLSRSLPGGTYTKILAALLLASFAYAAVAWLLRIVSRAEVEQLLARVR